MARDEKLELLRGVPLFTGLGRRELERLGELGDEVDLPAGRTFVREGDRGHEFFVILDGRVRIERGGQTLTTLGRGDFLGEIALVDGEGRIGALDTIFFDTLLDENAASHIAFGRGFEFVVADEAQRERVNESALHIDFMIGSPAMTVTGITADGERVPVLAGGSWAI